MAAKDLIWRALMGSNYMNTQEEAKLKREEKEAQRKFQEYMMQRMGGSGQLEPSMQVDPMTGRPSLAINMPQGGQRPPQQDIEATLGGGVPRSAYSLGGSLSAPSMQQTPESKIMQELWKARQTGKISALGQTAAQEMKESEKKQRDLRRVQLKLDQSTDLLARSYQKTQKTLEAAGIPLKAGRGLGGRAFGVAQKVMSKTGYNEYVKSYTGNLNEAAIALMRMAMPGRSERMVNLYKKTLPDMTGNPYEDISQVAESMTAAYGDALATQKDTSGKAKYSVAEARELRNKFKIGAYDRLKGVFVNAGLITPEEAATIKATSALGKEQGVKVSPELQKALKASGIKGKIKGIRKIK